MRQPAARTAASLRAESSSRNTCSSASRPPSIESPGIAHRRIRHRLAGRRCAMRRGDKERKERIADPFQGGPGIGTAAAQGCAATRTQGLCSRGRIGNPSTARAREVRCGYRMAGGHWGPPADRRSGVGCVCLRRRAATFPSCRNRGRRRGPAQPRSLFELFPFIVCATKRARP